jgi:hypothetical protein
LAHPAITQRERVPPIQQGDLLSPVEFVADEHATRSVPKTPMSHR